MSYPLIVKINEGTPQERVIGELYPDEGIFFKKVQMTKHLFRKLDAWGIDAKYFEDVLLPNNYFIQLHDTENHRYYAIEAKEFKKHSTFFHFKDKEDHRAQIFLPRGYWKILDE